MTDRQLTTKQFKFKEAIIRGLSDIDAAREAEYEGNDNVLSVQANYNLRNPKIIAAIAERRAEIKAKAEYGIANWRKDVLSARLKAEVAKHWSAVAAFDRLIGQHLGVFELDNKQKTEQRQLSEREKEQAQRIASIMLQDAG